MRPRREAGVCAAGSRAGEAPRAGGGRALPAVCERSAEELCRCRAEQPPAAGTVRLQCRATGSGFPALTESLQQSRCSPSTAVSRSRG